ncbi:4-carboxymuconolactone decarboxylase [Azorhizobium oxalatiphilum]|uniref:4-carboxymuconolactone decarboxylase n=1 Tax=Azorhizobium oxalatiphilum TaxID=980631 RepID=A0A917BTT1_9HYPH|nr:carboxymuconolactone decarboxylase family protein [Azorhizobium oxalatiphilum]GGF57138.1 4-carboxymuconolactone decarboxylase [Azorhizobium oxalatiphilum]
MRIKDLSLEEMSPDQRAVAEEAVSGKRGHVPAPLRAWLHSPELGRRAQHLGAFVRYDTSLSPDLSELAILVVARHWTAHFEWYAHAREGLKAGLSPQVLAAIASRETPPLESEAARAVYDFSRSVMESGRATDALYARATRALGERGVVDLVGVLGYYTMVAFTLNVFDIGLPDGETSPL